METLTTIIHQDFMKRKWFFSKTNNSNESNRVCYKANQISNPNPNPYDEIIIEYLPRTNQYDIVVPIGSVPYKKTFTDVTITIIADYIRMHLDYYFYNKM